MPRIARAQAYPSRPVTMVVPYLAGGPADGLARPLAERMSKALGQPVVVENIPGQSGVPGVERAVKAAPDGYTLSYGHNGSHVVNGAVYSLPYDLRSDLEPIALLPSNPLMISARKDFPGRQPEGADRLAEGQSRQGRRRQCRAGQRHQRQRHLLPEHHRRPFPVRAAQERADRDQGADHRRARPAVRSGLAFVVVSARRHHQGLRRHLEDADGVRARVPTTDEGGLPGFHSANWYGLWAPKGTPKDIVVRVNRAVVEALADPALAKQLSGQGLDMPPADQRTPEALAAFHKSEIEKWWPILQAAGIKAK